MEKADFVHIDAVAIERFAERVSLDVLQPAPRHAVLRFLGDPPEVARWTLLIDSLNFCFWSPEGCPWSVEYGGQRWQRYFALVAALRRAVARDAGWLKAERWASATGTDCEAVFAGNGRIPLLQRRVGILNETGRILLDRFAGEAIRLVEDAKSDAVRIAAAVCGSFPSFRDIHSYKGRQIPILKRAQIFASDVAAAFEEIGAAPITNLEGLTAFADYRLPQALRHLGMMTLSNELESRIESELLIEPGSAEELELRAGAIGAVDLITQALRRKRRTDAPSWLVDEYLWNYSHHPEVMVRHHRTLTWYY